MVIKTIDCITITIYGCQHITNLSPNENIANINAIMKVGKISRSCCNGPYWSNFLFTKEQTINSKKGINAKAIISAYIPCRTLNTITNMENPHFIN